MELPYRGGGQLIVLAVAAFLGLSALWLSFSNDETRFDQLAIGTKSKSVSATLDGTSLHCNTQFFCQYPAEGTRVLWIGASQLYVIGDYHEGENTIIGLLAQAIKNDTASLRTLALPNANFQELYVLFEAARSKSNLNGLIIGAVFDDMREEGVRNDLYPLLQGAPVGKALAESEAGRAILARYGPSAPADEAAPAPGAGADGASNGQQYISRQLSVENSITAWLESHWPLWKLRKEARGNFFVLLRKIRHGFGVFRQTLGGEEPPPSVVQFPTIVYHRNWSSLEAILTAARKAGIRVLVYVAPRPRDVPFPYDPEHYKHFKSQVQETVVAHGGHYIDLENAVSDDAWGEIPGPRGGTQKDLFHISGKGHNQLAAALLPAVKKHLLGLAR